MAISLKKDGNDTDDVTSVEEVGLDGFDTGFSTGTSGDSSDESSKYYGGIGDGTVSADKINDLPTYTGPTYIPTEGAGVSNQKTRSIIYKIIGILIIAVIIGGAAYGINYMIGSSGKDISNQLILSEAEIGLNLGITFEDNENKVKSVRQYTKGKVTVRSGGDLNIIYVDGKQVGVNTRSRKYRFYNVGINDAEKDVIEAMTYKYDDSMIVINDIMDGESDTYYYYNKKNNDCLVLVVNNRSNRIADMTYYTDYKKMTEQLSGLDDE